MKDKVKEALKLIREKNGFNLLRNCATIWEGYIKLTQILPEILLWDPVSARQLVFSLQRKHKINFGVCSFYEINDDGRQYCTINGKIECLCRIPELFCILRDTKRKNKKRKIKAF